VGCYLKSLVPFTAFVVLVYAVFPKFLLQQHDGMHLYTLVKTTTEWDGFSGLVKWAPLEGMGASVLAGDVRLLPAFYPYFWFSDPDVQIFLSYVIHAMLIYSSCFLLFSSLGAGRRVTVVASFLSFFVCCTVHIHHIVGPQGTVFYHCNFLLGILALVGTRRTPVNLCLAALFLGVSVIFLWADISTALLAGPALLAVFVALVFSCRVRGELAWKIATVLAALGACCALRIPDYAYLVFADTARVFYGGVIQHRPPSGYNAGIALHLEYSLSLVFLCALMGSVAVVRLHRRFDCPVRLVNVMRVVLVFLVLSTLVGWLFYRGTFSWPGPAPFFFAWCFYPLLCLAIVAGTELLVSCPPALNRDRWAIVVGAGLPFVLFRAGIGLRWPAVVLTAGALVSGLASLRLLGQPAASRVAVFLVICAIGLRPTKLYTIDDHRHARERLGLSPNPFTTFLRDRVTLKPGAPFRGYVDDYYSTSQPYGSVEDELMRNWHAHRASFGNGLHTFGWHVWGIPTLSQYSYYISPDYFYLYTHVCNGPRDRHHANVLAITKPDPRLLQMMGLSYLVTNVPQDPATGLRLTLSEGGIFVYRATHPNLFSYSPTRPKVAQSWAASVSAMTSPTFDPTRDVVVYDPGLEGVALTPATTTLATFERRNRFRIRAVSKGRSLLLLPVSFSNCWHFVKKRGDPGARIIRANVAMSAVVFTGEIDATVAFDFGLFSQHRQRWLDLADYCRFGLQAGVADPACNERR
jgi:hypothetical protein